MPGIDPYAPQQPGPYISDCKACDWSEICETDGEARMLAVLHVLAKHPSLFQSTTGKDPELASKVEYAQMLRYYRRRL